ncbi:Grx4 family monothiol glutaredoxin [Pelagibacteraceae bacterium]|nr:Grx4 family monothiol glutaredoxin [Pelagibacteraceae bacterium]
MNMDIKDKIKDILDKNDVCLFMKGTPDSPQCGFSMTVSNILKHLNVAFKGINILEDQSLREGIKNYSDWPTIPQLYIKGEFIGGCDIVKELFESKELKKLFEDKGIV